MGMGRMWPSCLKCETSLLGELPAQHNAKGIPAKSHEQSFVTQLCHPQLVCLC